MVNIVREDPGRDDEGWNPETVSKTVHLRRSHVIIKAAELVPSDDYRGGLPVLALHYLVHKVGHVVHATVATCRRMFTVWCLRRNAERRPCWRMPWSGHYTRNLGQAVPLDVNPKMGRAFYIPT